MLWVSHRGYHVQHCENSLAAFQEAYKLGFRNLETDLRVTADGVIVLCHDPDLARVAGDPRLLNEIGWAEVQQLRLMDGQSLLSLSEFLESFPDCHFIFDIKPESAVGVLPALRAIWSPHLAERVRFLFWQREHKQIYINSLGAISCMASLRECWYAGIAVLMGFPWAPIEPGVTYSLPPTLGLLSLYRRWVVARYKHKGANLMAYLPEDLSDIRRAKEVGFDEILVNGGIVS